MPIKDPETRRAYYRAWYRKRHPDATKKDKVSSLPRDTLSRGPIVKKPEPKPKKVHFWERWGQGGLVPD